MVFFIGAWYVLVIIVLISMVEISIYILRTENKAKEAHIDIFLFWKLIKIRVSPKFLKSVSDKVARLTKRKVDNKPLLKLNKIKRQPILKALRLLGKPIGIKSIAWQSRIGTGNAADTSIVVGYLLAGKWNIYSLCSRFAGKASDNVVIDVVPNYNNKELSIYLHCIFNFRIGHIIITGIKIIILVIASWLKGGEVFGRTSNRVANENSHGKH